MPLHFKGLTQSEL